MWQKIETAPKDGTRIRLRGPKVDPFTGYWDEGNMLRGWSMNERDVVFEPYVTHWRPLASGRTTNQGDRKRRVGL